MQNMKAMFEKFRTLKRGTVNFIKKAFKLYVNDENSCRGGSYLGKPRYFQSIKTKTVNKYQCGFFKDSKLSIYQG